MYLHSTFKFRAYVPLGLFLLVTLLIIYFTKSFIEKPDLPILAILAFMLLFLFIWVWLLFGELRTKAIKLEIHEQEIFVRNYLGFGIRKVYKFSQFDGFETALLSTQYGEYEYLYLIKNQKKIIKISQFYHANYEELKESISKKCKNLGIKPFKMSQELKEIFV